MRCWRPERRLGGGGGSRSLHGTLLTVDLQLAAHGVQLATTRLVSGGERVVLGACAGPEAQEGQAEGQWLHDGVHRVSSSAGGAQLVAFMHTPARPPRPPSWQRVLQDGNSSL